MVRNKKQSKLPFLNSPLIAKLVVRIESALFAKVYLFTSIFILLATTLFWSIKGAVLQLSNADQLVDPYLFQSSSTFHNAQFPGAHTFLLKWPLFYLIKLFGYSSASFVIITVSVVLLTIAILAFILYRIEHRPLVLGTLFLALASTLLLIPAQPYSGGLLPVNMAMLTTRNLEYAFYLASLMLFVRAQRIKSWPFWFGVLCLGVLIASDKLFLSIAIGGGILALLTYSLTKNWKLANISGRWLLGSIVAAITAVGIQALITVTKITNLVSQQSVGPYGLAHNLHDVLLGIVYSITGLLTNFGANPAYDTTVLRQFPHQMLSRMFGLGGFAFLINILILLAGLYCLYRIIRSSLLTRHAAFKNDSSFQLLIMMVFSTAIALFLFVLSNHQYSVDARYLTIAFFTIFIAIAVFTKSRKWKSEYLVFIGAIIIVGIIFGIFTSSRAYHSENASLAVIKNRDSQIKQLLHNRDGKVLVGDYWRVLPIKLQTGKNLNIMPLANCTQARSTLTSKTWKYNLNKQGFEYLLNLDQKLTNYPSCSFKQVVTTYGQPNSSTVIAGSVSSPKEIILRYDNGAHKSGPLKVSLIQPSDTIAPTNLSDLPYKPCNRPTVLTVVAHQDDDLLFMNPDNIHAIQAGYCMRTIYVTAGDGGNNKFYWLGREQGSESAYNTMLPGSSLIWEERIVKIANNQYVTIANPRGNSSLLIVFMRLPDGNLKGDGFKATNHESLVKLYSGKIQTIHSVDGQSKYTSSDLVSALDSLMHFFQPTEIHTQANYVSARYSDHSDHMTVGSFVKRVYSRYETEQFNNQLIIPIKYYIGYPVHGFAANVPAQDLPAKAAAYFAYSKYDAAVCKTIKQCNFDSTFGLYLNRQYTNPQ